MSRKDFEGAKIKASSDDIASFFSRFLTPLDGFSDGLGPLIEFESSGDHEGHDVHSDFVHRGRVLLNLLDGHGY